MAVDKQIHRHIDFVAEEAEIERERGQRPFAFELIVSTEKVEARATTQQGEASV